MWKAVKQSHFKSLTSPRSPCRVKFNQLALAFKSTNLADRYVRIENSKFHLDTKVYPTPGDGHDFHMSIFGLIYTVDEILALQNYIWNDQSFLPTTHARPIDPLSKLSDISSIAQKMAVKLEDNVTQGYLAQNLLRTTVDKTLTPAHFTACMNLLKEFKTETNDAKRKHLAQTISDVAFWAQWLVRGYLFEGKLHYEMFCSDVIPAPLSKIAFAANAALGRHQIEFVYDDYTLKAAMFPEHLDLDSVNYDDQKAILDAIAAIKTPVGFNDMMGGQPEHNFRHNHSLMEHQMKKAFAGLNQVFQGNNDGWNDIVEAARRANKIFKTMLQHTTPESYPMIRLPIKGVRGACGTVYHKHGVFYEGVGNDTYIKGDKTLTGVYVDAEFGQTGANSSMYKYFDLLIGVANVRQAFGTDPIMITKMSKVFEGKLDPGDLGTNPIDGMQRAFDLFTRPIKHMKYLVSIDKQVREHGILQDTSKLVMMQRLRLAFWVAEHRITHGQYVLKAIYQTEPVGGQSRADGTGGSTPPFLKLFLDQTLGPARGIIINLLLDNSKLTSSELQEINEITKKLDGFEERMTLIRNKGLQLEYDEKSGRN